MKHKLKYWNIILPEAVGLIHGFHIECYRRFVALSKAHCEEMNTLNDEDDKERSNEVHVTRSTVTSPKPLPRTGVFPAVCLFCSQKNKKLKGEKQPLCSVMTKDFEHNINTYAKWLNNNEMLAKITDVDFSAKIQYHSICHKNYQRAAESTSSGKSKTNKRKDTGKPIGEGSSTSGLWHDTRNIYAKAFDALKTYVRRSVIGNKEVHYLTDINRYYHSFIHEMGCDDFRDSQPPTQKLEHKLRQEFEDSIKIIKEVSRRYIVFDASKTDEEALRMEISKKNSDKLCIRNAVLLLRKEIMEADKTMLPETLTLEDINRGEIVFPELLTDFLSYLIENPDKSKGKSSSK